VFSEFELFDLVVAENGGLLFNPATKEEIPLAEAPSATLIERLRELGISPLSVGRCIVATWEPNETAVLKAIHDLGLELHIIFNKGAVMVLPSYVNKASGLGQALNRLGLSPYNVVGIGDAENDQAFLSSCGCAVAVANALPSVKEKVDFVVADHGAGVIETRPEPDAGSFKFTSKPLRRRCKRRPTPRHASKWCRSARSLCLACKCRS
jgi:hydroxymethylpyrimidine pyrophosphatase-like HAD family hydrolase